MATSAEELRANERIRDAIRAIQPFDFRADLDPDSSESIAKVNAEIDLYPEDILAMTNADLDGQLIMNDETDRAAIWWYAEEAPEPGYLGDLIHHCNLVGGADFGADEIVESVIEGGRAVDWISHGGSYRIEITSKRWTPMPELGEALRGNRTLYELSEPHSILVMLRPQDARSLAETRGWQLWSGHEFIAPRATSWSPADTSTIQS